MLSLAWAPLVASLVSLIISIAAIVVSTRQPEIRLYLPDQIRVAQGRESVGAAYVYLQPTFVSTGQNEQVEVIRDISLLVQPPSGPAVQFDWGNQMRLVWDASAKRLNYEYVADAQPLLVSPRTAASPLSAFNAPEGWFFQPGSYEFTVMAERVVARERLRDRFSVTLSPDHIAYLDRTGTDDFLSFPIQ